MLVSVDCPDLDHWEAIIDGTVPPEQRAVYEQHLESCAACQNRLCQAEQGEDDMLSLARQFGDPTAEPANSTLSAVLERLYEETIWERSNADEAPELYFLGPADRPGILGTLGHYQVLEIIGQGGMGVVLKAFEPVLHRLVAIKVLAPALAGSATARRRFTREGRAVAAISHDHVVTVHGVHEADGLPYLVMPFVAGESLQDRLDREGPLQLPDIVRIGLQTASGLAAAHAQGLIHRDIKPANLLLENGVARVKITDFGLARAADDVQLTQAGVVTGTPEYMAPEQARAEATDHRCDLFSLGSVLYAMCTGVPPFRGSTALGVLRWVSDQAPAAVRSLNPDVPVWLEDIIGRLMEKDPAGRFQSAAEVAGLLEGYLAHLCEPDLPVLGLPSRPAAAFTGRAEVPGRTGFRQSLRRFWLPALGLLAALGPVLALQLAGGGGEPAAKPEPGREYHEYHVPLNGRPENLPAMKLVGPNAETCVRFEPVGMRITLAPGFEGSRPQVGLSTGIALKGDFEVAVNFEVLKLPEPDDAAPATAFTLWLSRVKPDTCMMGISRRMVNTGPQFAAWSTWFDREGKQLDHKGEVIATEAKTGRLRLVRNGGELSCYVAEGPDGDFTLLNQISIGEQDLDDVRLVTFTHGPRAYLDGRFWDLSIRMGSLPGAAEAPKPTKSRGWLAAAAVLGVVLLLLFGLTLSMRRRRSRTEVASATPAENAPAGTASSVSFSCACGKPLRAKAELAGKKLRCPGCGTPVQVPGHKDDGLVTTPRSQ